MVFDSPKLDNDIRQLFRDNFPEIMDQSTPTPLQISQSTFGVPPSHNLGQQPSGGQAGASTVHIINSGTKFGSLSLPTLPSCSQPSVIQV